MRWIIRGVLTLFFGLHVTGEERVPARGPVILAANHPSQMDPVVLWAALPRRFTFLAAAELLAMPVLGAVVRPFRPVPVKRGAVDLRAIKLCLEHLARGEALLIFPEGKISRDGHLQAPHEGFAFLAYRAAVPVIPVGIRGTYRVWPLGTRFPHRERIEVYLGPAILPEGEPTREHQTELTAHLMRAIAGLAEETLNREGAAAQANGGDAPG